MTGMGALHAQLLANRFLPVPPPALMFCGDGDFRAIGAEFLGHLVAAGLKPGHRVLDIGCGVGRLAVPLTQYLDGTGSYEGMDPVAAGIAWCTRAITPAYPAIRFRHLDLRHALYNPEGTLDTSATPLPFPDASFDMVAMVSVLTHLHQPDALHYARETARLLRPGGRCFATAFLMNRPARAALLEGAGRIGFDGAGAGPLYESNPDVPLAGVAYDEDVLLELFLRHGLRRVKAQYGHWCGRPLPPFQDLCTFEKG